MVNKIEQITISQDDWGKCLEYQELKMKRAGHYGDREDVWGKGLRKDACAVGKGGEFAVKRWVEKNFPDAKVSEVGVFIDKKGYGDGGIDLIVDGITIDIKATSRGLYIPCSGAGSYKKDCDVFVWAQPRLEKTYWIKGYLMSELLTTYPQIDSYVGDHKIYDIPNKDLLDFRELLEAVMLSKESNG